MYLLYVGGKTLEGLCELCSHLPREMERFTFLAILVRRQGARFVDVVLQLEDLVLSFGYKVCVIISTVFAISVTDVQLKCSEMKKL